MAKPPHVALLIETSLAYGRGLLRGVARYIHEHGPWSVYFRPKGLDMPPPRWLERWRGDGILARINNRRMARAVIRTGLPTVDMRNALSGLALPGIGPDNRLVAELVFGQFLNSGISNFAFYAAPRRENRFLDARCEYFRALVEKAGYVCHIYLPQRGKSSEAAWEQGQSRLARWLMKLPKPVGLMACDDDYGLEALDACLRAGLAVPDQVAVIGVNNDEHLCGLSNPPLSSVDVNPERIGYEAAAMLDRLMAGGKAPRGITELPPRGLVVRQSSDVIGVADPQVSAALRFIRAGATEGISVGDVADAVDVSRSTLERRFVKLIGRTPKQEILRIQLERAKNLLSQTNLPMAKIAEKAGFGSAGYFCEVFHKSVGCTPGAYRNDHGIEKYAAFDRE